MEKELSIPTSDNKELFGLLRTNNSSKKLVIFVHGLTDHMDEPQFYLGARFFQEHAYDTFRFNLYGWRNAERNLIDCDISTHARDLNIVVSHFKNSYNQIFVVGHSLGGSSIILSDQDVTAQVFWDPSFKMAETANEFISYNKELDCYVASWGVSNLLSKKMMVQWKSFNPEEYVSQIKKPTKIIFAGEGTLKDLWQPYINNISVDYEQCIIEGAGHCFQEDGKFDVLFEETRVWFEKF